MFSKLGRYYKGRVYIKARGERLSEFINEALKDNVVFYNTRRLPDSFTAEVNIDDFSRLRRAAKSTGVEIRIRAKYGFPFVAVRWRKRKGLLVGLFLIFAAITILSQFVLSVTVEGNSRVPAEEIMAEAQKLGVKKWVVKRELDLDRLSKQLQENIPDIVWVTMEERGTNINIKVVEKTVPQKLMFKGDLIAAKTGVVEDIMVIQGEPLVHEGEMVKAGQVLIKATGGMKEYSFDVSGQSGASKESTINVPVAKGFVRGRVWYSSEKKVPLTEDIPRETGKTANGWGIKINDRVIMITNLESPFDNTVKETKSYNLPGWRNWRFPVEIINIHYKEIQTIHVKRTISEARQLAETLAREELKEKITPGAKVLREKVRIMSSGKGVEHIRVEAETYEELAVYKQ